MRRKKAHLFDEDGGTGNYWNRLEDDESDLFHLPEEGCPYCEYEGPLKSTRRGWKCPNPECRELVIPNGD